MTIRPAEPGTVSHGTLLDRDLIPRFAHMLKALLDVQTTDDYDPEHKHMALVNRADNPPTDMEGQFDLRDELFQALEVYAPPGHYFGTHPGDGSDFGYWPSDEEE